MNKLRHYIIAVTLALGLGVMMAPAPVAMAINVFDQCNGSDSEVCKASGTDNATSMITVVINTLFFLLGTIAVIMIIVGGVRYVVSNGDQSGIKSAKDTIMYAVIGLVVAMLSYAIVNFVVDQFIK